MLNSTFEHNKSILNGDIALTVDDVLLVPDYGIVESREEVIEVECLYTAPMDTVTNLDIYKKAQDSLVCPVLARTYLDQFINSNQKTGTGFISIGTSEDDIYKLRDYVLRTQQKRLFVSIDIAHGFSSNGLDQVEALNRLADSCDVDIGIMCGSIVTSDAAISLYECGVRYFRVGIGGGAMCTTRIMTGCGVPNLHAIFNIFNELKIKKGYKDCVIIADGGIRDPGTVAKYLAAGADCAMIGTAFSGCIDSPALIIDGKKVQRGQASYEFQMQYYGKVRNHCAEGVSTAIPIDIEFKDKAAWFYGGLRSATSYLGLSSIVDINPHNVKFIRVSPSTVRENNPICMM